MGLLQGANIRIVTPGSRLGMPEINIGLFPDVGGGWFLNHLPGKLGLFFALTASQMNAKDALELGLADHFLLDHQQEALINGMCQLNWQDQPALQLHSLLRSLSDGAQAALPAPQWLPRRAMITSLLDVADLPTAWKALLSLKEAGDPLLAKAGQTLAQGCPLTGHLIWQQLQRARRMSLAEVLRMEYTMSLNCCRHPEFPEGVRARLIDKDHAPRWHWSDVASVPQGVIDTHFQPVWEGEHPLADLV